MLSLTECEYKFHVKLVANATTGHDITLIIRIPATIISLTPKPTIIIDEQTNTIGFSMREKVI
jgi:hypothetical protein